MPRFEFLPIGPLAAALIIIGLAEGGPGFRAWGRRLIRWRVGWVWYAVALLLPALMALLTGSANMALGRPGTGAGGRHLVRAAHGLRHSAGQSDGRTAG